MEKHHLIRMALPKEYLMNSFKLIYKIFLVTACIATLGIVLAQTMQPPAMPGRMMVISESEYLSQMIPHHLEAIHTASIIADRSPRMQMRVFAKNIIRVQTTEVKQMQDWLNLWYINHRTKGFYQPMMRDLDKLSGNELDQVFFEDMIEHHHMAVMMSQHLMMRTANVHLEVLTFARNVRDTQMQEIQTMRLWLRNWFGTTFLNSSMGCQMH
jgi:uncharacterized protein (DUF305 family)